MPLHPTDVRPLIERYEALYLENLAMRTAMRDIPGWGDALINQQKSLLRASVAKTFAPIYASLQFPEAFYAAMSGLPQ